MKIGLKDQLGVSQGGQVHEGLRVRRSHLHPSSIHVPAKFAGRLMGLASFKRKCQCPEYFKNETLIGKENIGRPASSAGLGTGIREHAKMTIKAFRTVLDLEWWRHKQLWSQDQLNQAKRDWAQSKERTLIRKPVDDKNMVELLGRKRAWNAGGLQRNKLPQGSTGSKKARREETTSEG